VYIIREIAYWRKDRNPVNVPPALTDTEPDLCHTAAYAPATPALEQIKPMPKEKE
jgi:hypothetical protein